ncbi:DNA-binding transcriptional LysR family regulator [Rhizobium sp. BK529]|uniref:LysR family transcriptional regulator n=1 Tax=unclassified Rhizobium TaxID=2613769 RepID=UPI0010518B0C|nr:MULTISPECIES: LysR family transcriptional regulator [unclassified Rhizobium]MBB3595603.1 DNA-binding transcriptional LysR family regulator [Rhizobium sp. BK529]TCS00607.1 LysR family transcriptional regulator [Rhizobium sp. BK418]
MAFDGRLLSGVSTLAAVVESGSFVKAADALGLSASGVSRAISRLEARVGVRLLDRTTRSVRLTDEGARFHAQVVPHLDGIAEAATLASGASLTVRGRLRVDVDPIFSRMVLAPHLKEFVARYPELELELITRELMSDLVADGIDIAIRFGQQPSSSRIARKLMETRVLTVATPAYLAEHGTPKLPTDIASHSCIQFRDPLTGRTFEWELHRGRKIVQLDARGPLLMSDPGTMLDACLAGAGVAQVLALSVRELLSEGRLVELYPDWPDETFPLYAVHPSRHHVPAKVNAFIEFCLELIRD